MKLFSKIAALSVGLAMAVGVGVAVGSKSVGEAKAADEITNTITFGGGESIGSYTSSFTETDSANTSWTIAAFNNNQWKWSSSVSGANKTIKCGRKNVDSVGSIYNTSSLSSTTFTKVDLYISALTSGKLNSIKVYGGSSSGTSGTVLATVTSVTTSTSNPTSITLANQSAYAFYTIAFDMASGSGNGLLSLDKVCWYKNTTPAGTPSISVDKGSLEFLSNGSAQNVTVTATDFSSTPTISIEGFTSYVNCSVSGLTISVSPKAVGSETVTVKAVNNTEQASATFTVNVLDKHGRVSDDPFSVAEIRALINQDQSKTHEGVYVEGIVSQVDEYKETYHSITYWISDDGSTTDQFECYSGKGIESADFSSINDVEVGGVAVVCGDAKYYSGTYEFNYNNYQISYTAPVSTDFTVSFNGNGATGSMSSVSTHGSYNLPANGFNIPSGQMFVGWKADNAGGIIAVNDSFIVSQNVEFYAQWANICVVSFDAGAGTGTMASVEVAEGSDYTLPACAFTAPTGKVFDYWDLNGTKTTVIQNIDGDYEVTAIYKDQPTEVVFTFAEIAEAEGWINAQAYTEYTITPITIVAEGEGNNGKWYTSGNGSWRMYSGGTVRITAAEGFEVTGVTSSPSCEFTINNGEATFSPSARTDFTVITVSYSAGSSTIYTISYDGNGSTSGSMNDTVGAHPAVAGCAFAKEGYDFARWNTQADGEGDDYAVGYVAAEDLTLYAIWQEHIEPIGANVTMENVNNSSAATITVGTVVRDGLKCGTGSKKGEMKLTLKVANITKVKLYVGCWNGNSENTSVDVTINNEATVSPTTLDLVKDSGFTGNTNDFTLAGAESLFKQELTISSGTPADTEITISAQNTSNNRFIVWGATDLYAEDFASEFNSSLTCDASGEDGPTFAAGKSWTTLESFYNGLDAEEQGRLHDATFTVEGSGSSTVVTATGETSQSVAEAMARYDFIEGKYNPTDDPSSSYKNFIGRTVHPLANSSYALNYQSNLDSSSSITIIVIVAVTSMTLLGVTLVLRKRKHQ